MADLKSPKLIWLKGVLFLYLGVLSSALLILQAPNLTVVFLLCMAIWSFCRFYYFAFYVIQNYVDSKYRFAGLLSFAHYALFQRRREQKEETNVAENGA